ncbi:MAG: tRNA (adenosine(37)-N6)-threonylcarbamoyltransferase complex dimerization subunit type 1 TsaB, partial [Armatimonadetes bacterium CG07_land_8_20_14_0_80_40_9]
MLILGIDTSQSLVSLAILSEERLWAEYSFFSSKTQLKRLIPTLKKVLEDAGLTVRELEGIAISLGPGSFTGLRLGLATAKGLAQGLNIPLVGIPSLDVLARNLLFAQDLICPILDARRKEVYTAIYRSKMSDARCQGTEQPVGVPLGTIISKTEDGRQKAEPHLKKLTSDLVISPEKLIEQLENYKEKVIFLGNGLIPYGEKITKGLKKRALFAPANLWSLQASNLAYLGLKRLKEGDVDDLFTLKPKYVRRWGEQAP